ncbi:Uncharacterised protein [Vibrio cholerae]|nr:Uncharacterised protein [Vibrio cholerae]
MLVVATDKNESQRAQGKNTFFHHRSLVKKG